MKIRLVPCNPDYAELFFSWRNEAFALAHNPFVTKSVSELRESLGKEGSELSDLKKYSTYRWFIEADQMIVGHVSLNNINHMMNTAEIGYGVGEPHQRRGIATQAVQLLIAKIFGETGLRKLLAFVHDENFPSCRLLDRLGFRREGLLREHYLINGAPANEVLFGLLKGDLRNWS